MHCCLYSYKQFHALTNRGMIFSPQFSWVVGLFTTSACNESIRFFVQCDDDNNGDIENGVKVNLTFSLMMLHPYLSSGSLEA